MRNKLLFLVVIYLLLAADVLAQGYGGMTRSTTAHAGGKIDFAFSNSFVIRQSVGQASVTGTFEQGKYAISQGFIMPLFLSKTQPLSKELTKLNANVYPNPFSNDVFVVIQDKLQGYAIVKIYSSTSRLVFEQRTQEQKIDINISSLHLFSI